MGSNTGGKWGWGSTQCWGGDMNSNSWGQCWGGSSVNFWEQKPGSYSPCPAGSYKPYPGEACCQCALPVKPLQPRGLYLILPQAVLRERPRRCHRSVWCLLYSRLHALRHE